MSQGDVDIRVQMDTSGADSDARELDRERSRLVTKAKSMAASRVRMLIGAVGGMAAVYRVRGMHSGNVDPWTASMIPFAAAVQQATDEAVGYSAIARKRSADDVATLLADNAYRTKSTAAAKDYYQTVLRMNQEEEDGRNIVRQQLRGPSVGELMEKAIPGYLALVGRSFGYMMEALTR